ncbi:hypothetical protein HQ585_02975 [candidate division KSB1 bacterium]|nr:hypothetical protein [candidate division KSB1 bacterium]
MTERLMDLEYLLNTEKQVKEVTLTEWGVGSGSLTKVINLFFSLSHFLNEDCEIESDDNAFQIIAYSSYLRLPYTLKTIQDLWLLGYYLESFIIVRHIVEGFAKLRYFTENRNEITPHFTARKHRDRVSFKTMFDSVAPGYYHFHYGKLLSGYAHGDLNAYFTRTDYTSQTEGRVIAGCEFNDIYCGLIINLTLTFCYGHLNYLQEFFPSILDKLPKDLLDHFLNMRNEMKLTLNSKRKKPEQQQEWENVIRPFVEQE